MQSLVQKISFLQKEILFSDGTTRATFICSFPGTTAIRFLDIIHSVLNTFFITLRYNCNELCEVSYYESGWQINVYSMN